MREENERAICNGKWFRVEPLSIIYTFENVVRGIYRVVSVCNASVRPSDRIYSNRFYKNVKLSEDRIGNEAVK